MKTNQKPIVLIDCERTKKKYVGLYQYCNTLLNSINKINNKSFELACYLPKSSVFAQLVKNNIFNLSIFHKFFFPNFKEISIYHATQQSTDYFPQRKNNWKLVLTIHDFNFLIEKESNKKKKNLLSKIKNKINKSDKVIFISDYVFKQAISFWGYSSKYTRIYNGVNSDITKLSTQPISHLKKPFLLALGTVLPKKNFHTLIPLLINNNYQLAIAGKENDDYVQLIKNLASKNNLSQRVIFLSYIEEEEKRWLYKNCVAFLFPSIAEGFGLPIIEAMLFGKPCFISNKCSLPEVGGNVAYYFNNFSPLHMQKIFEDGMNHFLLNKEENQLKIKNWALKFSSEKQALEYIKVYQELIDSDKTKNVK